MSPRRSLWDDEGNLRDLSDREAAHLARKWVLIFIGACVIFSLGAWLVSAALAPQVGQVNQRKIINNPTNQIAQYQQFFDLDKSFRTDLTRVSLAAKVLSDFSSANPPSGPDLGGTVAELRSQYTLQLTAAQSACTEVANTYNAQSASALTGGFRDWRTLPQTEDPTKCEATP